jgi:hypothetical protein
MPELFIAGDINKLPCRERERVEVFQNFSRGGAGDGAVLRECESVDIGELVSW